MSKSNYYGDPKVILALEQVLADAAVLYYKTHTFHWNVEDHNFYGLHLMFEKFYNEVWESLDEIAERIRAVGGKAPPSLASLLRKASLKETEDVPDAVTMVMILRDDYRAVSEKTRKVAALAAEQGDGVTENMLEEKATALDKAAWMLEASLKS